MSIIPKNSRPALKLEAVYKLHNQECIQATVNAKFTNKINKDNMKVYNIIKKEDLSRNICFLGEINASTDASKKAVIHQHCIDHLFFSTYAFTKGY